MKCVVDNLGRIRLEVNREARTRKECTLDDCHVRIVLRQGVGIETEGIGSLGRELALVAVPVVGIGRTILVEGLHLFDGTIPSGISGQESYVDGVLIANLSATIVEDIVVVDKGGININHIAVFIDGPFRAASLIKLLTVYKRVAQHTPHLREFIL